jgi:FKBP-type peptidyl-prolyl cis-trans isomerase FkpA
MRTILVVLAAALVAAGCSSPTAIDMRWAVPENIEYDAALNIDLDQMQRTASGLYIQDVEVGTGARAEVGRMVYVAYRGWLPDATLFDSRDRTEALGFRLGIGLVIRGWDEGLVGMQVGGKRRLVIRPELAYGTKPPAGSGIPPMSTLIFEVEMLNVLN